MPTIKFNPITSEKDLFTESWESGDNVIAVKSVAMPEFQIEDSDWSDPLTINVGDLEYTDLGGDRLRVDGCGGSLIEKLEIPSMHQGKMVVEIKDNAFENNDVIQELTIPKSISKIGKYAFKGSVLKKVTFEDTNLLVVFFKSPGWGQPYISYRFGDYGDADSSIMQLYDAGESIYSCAVPADIRDIIFYSEDRAYQTYNYPLDGTPIGNRLFLVKTQKLGSDTYYVVEPAYYDNLGLDFNLYGGLQIGTEAFANCIELDSITLPKRTTSLGQGAFKACTKLETVSFTKHHRILTIGNYAFDSCTSLEVVTMYDGVRTIGSSAFYNCNKLSSCVLGDGLQEIRVNAFGQCAKLEYVTIPASVKRIEKFAFEGMPTNNTSSERKRWIIFEAPSTWVMTEDNQVAPDGSGVTVWSPRELYGTTNEDGNVTINGERLSTVYYAFNWIKLEKMLTPKVSLSGSILSMTDPLGIVDAFNIYTRDPEDGSYKFKCYVRVD